MTGMFTKKKPNIKAILWDIHHIISTSKNLEELADNVDKIFSEKIQTPKGDTFKKGPMVNAIRCFNPLTASTVTRAYGMRQQCYMLWHHDRMKKKRDDDIARMR